MRIIKVTNPDSFARQKEPISDLKQVRAILEKVRQQGDTALREFESKFNKVSLSSLRVSKSEIADAYKNVTEDQLDAIKMARKNLARVESTLKQHLKKIQIASGGTKIAKSFVPLGRVGCYVPGGLARYPSSAVMSIVPAKIAGVGQVIVATPPNRQGKIDPLVLVASDLCGADMIFKVSGAHAIAALAYGTESIPQVDKIVGPGGAFVTAAKHLVSERVSIDMLAGPTELGIIADELVDPEIVAADLISQSEHSSDTVCFLLTTSKKLADRIKQSIKKQVPTARRGKIVMQSLEKNGFIALCKSQSDMINLANRLAPEHLQIMTKNPKKISDKIGTAGLVLVGNHTPSAASDYLFGTNHILPTNRLGRSRGSLSVLDFVKVQTTVESSRQALRKIEKNLRTLAESEDLPNHYEAVRKRL
ncbi:MAG: histidinol dehydrogenase [Candidatus Nitrosotenuis sp.]